MRDMRMSSAVVSQTRYDDGAHAHITIVFSLQCYHHRYDVLAQDPTNGF